MTIPHHFFTRPVYSEVEVNRKIETVKEFESEVIENSDVDVISEFLRVYNESNEVRCFLRETFKNPLDLWYYESESEAKYYWWFCSLFDVYFYLGRRPASAGYDNSWLVESRFPEYVNARLLPETITGYTSFSKWVVENYAGYAQAYVGGNQTSPASTSCESWQIKRAQDRRKYPNALETAIRAEYEKSGVSSSKVYLSSEYLTPDIVETKSYSEQMWPEMAGFYTTYYDNLGFVIPNAWSIHIGANDSNIGTDFHKKYLLLYHSEWSHGSSFLEILETGLNAIPFVGPAEDLLSRTVLMAYPRKLAMFGRWVDQMYPAKTDTTWAIASSVKAFYGGFNPSVFTWYSQGTGKANLSLSQREQIIAYMKTVYAIENSNEMPAQMVAYLQGKDYFPTGAIDTFTGILMDEEDM